MYTDIDINTLLTNEHKKNNMNDMNYFCMKKYWKRDTADEKMKHKN